MVLPEEMHVTALQHKIGEQIWTLDSGQSGVPIQSAAVAMMPQKWLLRFKAAGLIKSRYTVYTEHQEMMPVEDKNNIIKCTVGRCNTKYETQVVSTHLHLS